MDSPDPGGVRMQLSLYVPPPLAAELEAWRVVRTFGLERGA